MEIVLSVPLLVVALKYVYASCPPNAAEFLNTCYSLNNTAAQYFDAEKTCQQQNGILIRMKSSELERFIETTYPGVYFWIGLSDKDRDGNYEWADGTTPEYTNWTPTPSSEECVIFKDSVWQPISCTVYKYFICEEPKVYDTTASQTGAYYGLLAKQQLDDAEDYKKLRVINSKMCAQHCLQDINECIGFSVSKSALSCYLYRLMYGKTAIASNYSSIYKLF